MTRLIILVLALLSGYALGQAVEKREIAEVKRLENFDSEEE